MTFAMVSAMMVGSFIVVILAHGALATIRCGLPVLNRLRVETPEVAANTEFTLRLHRPLGRLLYADLQVHSRPHEACCDFSSDRLPLGE